MELYDVIIVGAGPAGLTAAIYLTRAQYRVLVIEKENIGGQITITSEVVNYPGILKTDGKALTLNMRRQAENFGAEFLSGEVDELDLQSEKKVVTLKDGRKLEALGIVLALGASPRTAGFKGELEFRGRGIAYCATCDGEFFDGKDIFVVGGGFAAAEEAMFLTKYGRKVTILVRKDKFSCAQSVVDELLENPRIEIKYNTEVEEAGGDGFLQYAVLKNNKTGELTRYEAEHGSTFGLFVFAGYAPATELVKDIIELNDAGYIITDRQQKTNVNGVYAAGDVCVKNLRQVVTAVSDGAVAATELEKYVSQMHKSLGIIPTRPQPKLKHQEPQPEPEADNSAPADDGDFLSAEIKQQLAGIFARLDKPLTFRAILDQRDISKEIKGFLEEICQISPMLSAKFEDAAGKEGNYPEIRLETEAGYSGISFHALPGGHEMNSFVIAIFNLAGPSQPIEDNVQARILALKPTKLEVLATLSCTMCPELVMAAQRIAAINPKIEAHMYDLNIFPEIKQQLNIMSVPALLIDGGAPLFGKKDILTLLDILEQ